MLSNDLCSPAEVDAWMHSSEPPRCPEGRPLPSPRGSPATSCSCKSASAKPLQVQEALREEEAGCARGRFAELPLQRGAQEAPR